MQAENVTALEDTELKKSTIQFDFLGKDSVQYVKEIEVARPVYKNIAKWTRKTTDNKSALFPASLLFFSCGDMSTGCNIVHKFR